MKKYLIVSDKYPLPEDNGSNQRTMLFVRYFKNFGEVDVIYSGTAGEKHPDSSLFRKEIHLSKRSDHHFTNFLLGYPWCIRLRASSHFRKELLRLVKQEEYDTVLIRYLFDAHIFFHSPSTLREKIVLDVDDILSSDSLYPLMHSISSKYTLKQWLDLKQLKTYENKCYRSFGKILFSSSTDQEKIQKKSKRNNIFVVTNVMESEQFLNYEFGNGYENDNTLLFVGGLHYQPNIAGLKWFVENVFEPFRDACPEAKLLVVGKSPGEEVKKICDREGVELHPDVPDVRPFYVKAKAVIVPILHGGGTRIKIIEASLSNRPVLTTKIGKHGLNYVDDKEILVFNDSESFLNHYRRLENEEYYRALTDASRTKSCTDYSYQNFKMKMDEVCTFHGEQ